MVLYQPAQLAPAVLVAVVVDLSLAPKLQLLEAQAAQDLTEPVVVVAEEDQP